MSLRNPHWTCYRCARGGVRAARSVLCIACHQAIQAAGQRWCPRCQHVLSPDRFGRHTSYCKRCVNAYKASDDQREKERVTRRQRYRVDPNYRAERIASARRYWPLRRYKLRVIGYKRGRKAR